MATLTGRKFRVFYSVSGGTRLLHRFGPRTASRRTRREGRHGVEDKQPDRGERARAACGGYICFEDETGFTRRPTMKRTLGRRGVTPQMTGNRPPYGTPGGGRAEPRSGPAPAPGCATACAPILRAGASAAAWASATSSSWSTTSTSSSKCRSGWSGTG
ncbi:hypothetical protein [Streptomyces sp. b94]|uniref:hypothetical protein n=1 Tax=Streptomyces sp. b94 TaxID=1827634 RepID=UPI0027DBC36B|nr:hypothetical protein [Streptomyces sp. b94]